jgi:hypothetical protein
MRAGKEAGRAARCESENGVLQKLRAAHPFGLGFVGGSAVQAGVIVVSRLTLAKTFNWGKQRKRRSEGRLLVVQTLPTPRMQAPGNLSKGQSVLPPRVRRQRDLRQIAPGPFFEFPLVLLRGLERLGNDPPGFGLGALAELLAGGWA